jgi:hypothetical protein
MLKNTAVVVAAVVVALTYIAAPTATAQPSRKYQWKLETAEEGCQTYTSAVAGKEYIAAKGICVVPARMDVIGMVLRDISGFPNWMEDCKATKVLRVVNDRRDMFLFWFRQHIPLFADRDMVLKTETEIRPGHARIKAFSTNEMAYDSGGGFVRMPSFISEFSLEWIDREHTKVTFMIDPDLGGGLPTGISNSTIKNTPYKSLLGLAKMAQQPRYVETARGSAYEKAIIDGINAGTLK